MAAYPFQLNGGRDGLVPQTCQKVPRPIPWHPLISCTGAGPPACPDKASRRHSSWLDEEPAPGNLLRPLSWQMKQVLAAPASQDF